MRTDRPDGDVTATMVIACDGVNSFVAKEAGLYGTPNAKNFTLGVKETLALPKDVIDERFGVRGREGVDIEIIGCTGGINGGGFVYTNLDTIAVGVVLKLTKLASQKTRPEEIIAAMKRHSAIAPLVEGGELKEYSAHLIPEAGLSMMPEMTGHGLLVAGDAAALCLAAGIWLEGVNFAMASGMYAGQTAVEAIADGDVSQRGLGGYARRLSDTFVLRDHRKLRRAPELVLERPRPTHVSVDGHRDRRAHVPCRQPGSQAWAATHRARGAQARRRERSQPVQRQPRRFQELRMIERDATWPEMSFSDRMETTEFKVSDKPHIVVDGKACVDCSTRACIVACPADLFVPTSDGGIVFNYEQCFECGTCYLVCDKEGAITWSYPEGGFGVIFRST